MSFLSGLKKFGEEALKFITFGDIAAATAAPFVSAFNPAVGALLTGSAQAVMQAEVAGATAVSSAPPTATGAQKAAIAVQAITPIANTYTKTLGLSAPTQEQVAKFNDLLVAALNVFGTAQQEATVLNQPEGLK